MITIVLGMHRSGTSLVSGLLHNAGILMGDKKTFEPKPTKENPRGFYENITFRRLNDKILLEHRYIVKGWSEEIPDILNSAMHRRTLDRVKSRYNRLYKSWGAKDPRFSLTLNAWKFAPSEAQIVYVYRNPNEVAKSLRTRKNTDTDEAGLRLWNAYNQKALKYTENYDTIFLDYKDVLAGLSGIPDKGNLIDIKLRHNESAEIPETCKATWDLLLDRCAFSGTITLP